MAWSESTPVRGMPSAPKLGTGTNYLKTAMLMAFLIAILAIGGSVWGGYQGMLLFGGIGLLFNFGSYWFSDRIALAMHRAQPVTEQELPQLYEVVGRLTRRAGLPMPKLYVIPSDSPNAFATGRNPSHAAVAVTQGIMKLLDWRELEGVLAHELSHVKNRDILISTIAAAVAGLISSLGHMIQWGAMLGGFSSRDDDRRGGGIEMLAWAILAPIMALVIQLAVSRSREYGADASGAALLGDPEPLADALLKLERGNEEIRYQYGGPATAHLFIVHPFSGMGGKMLSLMSTHPPIEERVRRLREMKRGMRYA
jgi:heat shock protein HtpX